VERIERTSSPAAKNEHFEKPKRKKAPLGNISINIDMRQKSLCGST